MRDSFGWYRALDTTIAQTEVTNGGSGLVGLVDGVEAVGGHLSLDVAWRGTLVAVELPLATHEAVPLRPEAAAVRRPATKGAAP